MMQHYVVLYRMPDSVNPLDAPLIFLCQAEDVDHAEEQCDNAYPGVNIVWVESDMTVEQALEGYYDWHNPWQSVEV